MIKYMRRTSIRTANIIKLYSHKVFLLTDAILLMRPVSHACNYIHAQERRVRGHTLGFMRGRRQKIAKQAPS